jgi:hypothetical protein
MADNNIQAEPPDPRRRPVPPAVQGDEAEPAFVEPVESSARPRHRDDELASAYRRADDEAVQVVIPYKNPLALASYYVGVFSLIPCAGLILGPIALVLGILGYRRRAQDPRLHGTGHAIAGIVLGTLTTLGYYGVLAAVLIAILRASSR